MLKFMRRSDYARAVNATRKACRRGDIATAERWLRHADRLKRHEVLMRRGVHEELMHDEQLDAARDKAEAERQALQHRQAGRARQSVQETIRSLHEGLDQARQEAGE